MHQELRVQATGFGCHAWRGHAYGGQASVGDEARVSTSTEALSAPSDNESRVRMTRPMSRRRVFVGGSVLDVARPTCGSPVAREGSASRQSMELAAPRASMSSAAFLWLDSIGATAGSLTLLIKATRPSPRPQGFRCSACGFGLAPRGMQEIASCSTRSCFRRELGARALLHRVASLPRRSPRRFSRRHYRRALQLAHLFPASSSLFLSPLLPSCSDKADLPCFSL